MLSVLLQGQQSSCAVVCMTIVRPHLDWLRCSHPMADTGCLVGEVLELVEEVVMMEWEGA